MENKIITNHKDSWELYSTITDTIIWKFKTEKDLKKFLALEVITEAKIKAIQELLTFPNGRTINGEFIFTNKIKKNNEKITSWLKSIRTNPKNYEDYFEKVDKKLQELLNK